ncbi:MAG: alpha/beta fold hydrolase [Candidatus Hydrogenedentes bacterium]|nr:alpha/beta fold hydrolase [Candidatus Hydrogenedentota bacterium]
MKRLLVFSLLLLSSSFLPALAEAPAAPPVVGEEAHKLLVRMYDYDATIPLEARVVQRETKEGTTRDKVVFRSTRSFMVPGYFEVSETAKAPYPCVVLMHGWSGSKEHWWKDGGYLHGGEVRKALLAAGFAVFALDAQGHGDRIAENDYHVVNLFEEPGAPPRKNYFTLRDVITQTVLDYRRGIDYLATRGDVDMTRIGAMGYSMGGFHAVSLTAVEPRIKAAVGCVVPVSWREDPILDPANYLRGIGERPFMMVQGKTDELCNEAQALELYKHLEGPNTKLEIFDSGHKLPGEYVGVAVPWLIARI